MAWLVIAGTLLIVGGLGWWLTRLIARLGEDGLIDYTPRRPTKRGFGMALMGYHALFEPAVEHVIEYQRAGDLTIQTSDEPAETTDPTGDNSSPAG
ncbi:MAG: hypothetical protein ACT4OP_06550 [Actinomycetota bacterium]